jgi:hypothetical protein
LVPKRVQVEEVKWSLFPAGSNDGVSGRGEGEGGPAIGECATEAAGKGKTEPSERSEARAAAAERMRCAFYVCMDDVAARHLTQARTQTT